MNTQSQTLDDLMAHAQHYAEFALRYGGQVPPTAMLVAPGGLVKCVTGNLPTEPAKDHFASTVRTLAVAHDAKAVVMVLESWALSAPPGGTLNPDVRPSQAPDRQEVVALIGEAPGIQQATFLTILRTISGTFAGFGEPRMQHCDHAEGRFAQILPISPPTPEEKARARAILQAQGMREQRPARKPRTTAGYWH